MPRQLSSIARLLAMALFTWPLLACSNSASNPTRSISLGVAPATGSFWGGVVSAEPEASLIGQAALEAGGSAADAAAAMYFTLAVTYPNAAGLGGGGLCTLYPPGGKSGEVLDFRAGQPALPGPIAAPGNVRGFAALQARYGHMRWAEILAPAERLARFGFPLSHASAKMLASLSPASRARIPAFLRDRAGRPLAEGALVHELALGGTLDRLRTAGINSLYTGDLAHRFLAAARADGGTLTLGDLMQTVAHWRKPESVPYDNLTLLMPAGDPGSGIFAALWQNSVTAPGLLGLKSGHVSTAGLLSAMAAAYGGIGGNLPVGGAGTTGFIAMDAAGEAVACTVTMGQAFGTGKLAGSTGILLASASGGAADESRFLAPVIVANLTTHQAVAAIAGSGGAVAPAAAMQVLARVLAEGQSAKAAQAAPRLFRAGRQAVVLHEAGLKPEARAAIAAVGAQAMPVAGLGRVALGLCLKGLGSGPQSCRFVADPRGFGLAAASTP